MSGMHGQVRYSWALRESKRSTIVHAQAFECRLSLWLQAKVVHWKAQISPIICPQLTQLLTLHKPESMQWVCYFSLCQSFCRSAWRCTQVTHIIKVLLSISASQLVLFKSLLCSPSGQNRITRLSSVPITVITCDKPHRGPINTLLSPGPRN